MSNLNELYVVIPMANDVNDDWSGPGPNFKKRCERAEEVVHSLRSLGRDVVLAQGAGKPEWAEDRMPTLGSLNAEYLKSLQLEVPILVNDHEPEVWSSLDEVYWILREIKKHYPANVPIRLVFVTQRRHLWRMRVIAFCVVPRAYTTHFVRSGQTKEISLLHEARAYVALCLSMTGFADLVRWIRRRVSLKVDRL